MGQRGHHRLLAGHPVQVATGQVVALANEAECLRPVKLLPARGEVGTRKRFVNRLFQADVDAAEGVGDQGEAEQPDFGVVVDGDAGQVGDGLDQRFAAGLSRFRFRLVLVPFRLVRPAPSTSPNGPIRRRR